MLVDGKFDTPIGKALSVRPSRAMTLLMFLALLLGSFIDPQCARGQGSAEEYQVKAAFLFHFAQLVEWPASAGDAGTGSLTLCAFDQAAGQEVRRTIDGKSIGGQTLHVHLLQDSRNFGGCSILFLAQSDAHQPAILRAVRALPILTVGETNNFLSDGGMIRFHLQEDKIRFDINAAAADLAQLKISSQLLLLATSVQRGGMRGGG